MSVVFSFYNEADVLPELVRRVRAAFVTAREQGDADAWELIFVNDASTDDSEDVLRSLAEGHTDIRLINMSRNFGVSPCVLAGMEYARGDAVIYMDADLQDPPEVIPRLLAAWRAEQGIDVVHTVRTKRTGESHIKLLITRLGYWILQKTSNINLPIEAGDFKLLSRRAVRELLRFGENRPFIRGLVCWIGFRQKFVEYEREARFSGKTKFPVLGLKVIRNFFDSAVISFSDVPLKFSIVCGMLASVLALLYMGWVLLEKYRGHNLPGWTATNVAILFLGGVQLLSIGILGLYVNSIFIESKRRPNRIVRDVFGFPESPKPTQPADTTQPEDSAP